MRKVSEILLLCMPSYTSEIGRYMCLIPDGSYAMYGDNTSKDHAIEWPETLALRDVIEERIQVGNESSYTCTLDLHLMVTCDKYRATAESRDTCQLNRMQYPPLHALRVQWYENLIIELQKEGK